MKRVFCGGSLSDISWDAYMGAPCRFPSVVGDVIVSIILFSGDYAVPLIGFVSLNKGTS